MIILIQFYNFTIYKYIYIYIYTLPFNPYLSRRYLTKTGNITPPSPLPENAIPFAIALLSLKYSPQ